MARLRKAYPVPAGGKISSQDFFDVKDLHCYGCLHSSAREPFPSGPSGERPCLFCLRNPKRPDVAGAWYDGSDPIRTPMDAYMSVDLREQMIVWLDAAAGPSPEERQAIADRLLDLLRQVQS